MNTADDYRRFVLLLVAICSLCLLVKQAHAESADSPNFVVIVVDDLGYMDIGAYNPDTFYKTPNVDQLAAESTRFTSGYSASPVCSPTRYSVMTGRYPTRVDATNWFSGMRKGRFLPAPFIDRMPLEEITLAETLRAAGYRTAFVGKWHLGPSEEYWPKAQGFEINVAGHTKGSPPGGYFSPYKNPRLNNGPNGEYLTDRLAEESVGILRELRDDPFLLVLCFYSVHTPLQAPKELVEKYEEKAAESKTNEELFEPEEQNWPIKKPRRTRVVQNHPTYAGMVESMDRSVGRVLDELESLGLDENTVVCFVSDNGGLSTSEGSPTSNVPLRGGKGWVYEGGIRIPYMIKWPGATSGKTCDVPVITNDLYPTLLEIAELPPMHDQHVDGESLAPLLNESGPLERIALFWHYPHYGNQGGFPGGAIRMGDWKLLERYEDDQVHLYNLADDIGERNDLAASEPLRVSTLRQKLHDWYEQLDAKFLRPLPQ